MPAQHKVAGAVEIVRRTYRFIEDVRDDRLGDLDEAFGALVDEGFELHLPPSYPEGVQVFRGRNGLMRWIARFSETWGEWRFELERFVRAGDRVLVLVRVVARGGLSGVRLERETAHIWTLKDGLVTRCEVYLDRSEGVEALRRV